jgi:hypothetical protein
MRNTLRKVRTVGVLGALLLVTSGCIQEDVGVKVFDDGSAEVDIRLAIDYEKFSSMAGVFGGMSANSTPEAGMPQEVCAELMSGSEAATSSLPEGLTLKTFKDERWCGLEIIGKLADAREVNSVLGALEEATSFADEVEESGATTTGATPSGADVMQFEKLENGGWSFKMTDPLGCATEGSDGSSASEFGSVGEALLADFQLKFDIQLPGIPGENNATSVDGNTFTWQFGYKAMEEFCRGGDVEFRALTTAGSLPASTVADAGNISEPTAAPEGSVVAERGLGSSDDKSSKLPLVIALVALVALFGGGGAAIAMKSRRGPITPQDPSGDSAMYQAPQPQNGEASWNQAAMRAELREARTTPAATPATPVWDAELGAWVVTSPTGGTFVQNAETGEWLPKP